jgi:hypothetical protein
VRSLGDAGALSEGDVTRALGLIPELGATPATEREARAKFTELRKIISGGVDRLNAQGGNTSGAPASGGYRFLGFEE